MLAACDDPIAAHYWVDDIINPKLISVTANERRVVAEAFVSQVRSSGFELYKVSITTTASSLADVETDEFLDHLREAKLHVRKRRIVASGN